MKPDLSKIVIFCRKNLTSRQIRYLFAKYFLSPIPWLRHHYAAYSKLTNLDQYPDALLENKTISGTIELDKDEIDYLNTWRQKSNFELTNNAIILNYKFSAFGVDDCEVLSQSMSVIDKAKKAVLLCPMAPLNRNVIRPYRYKQYTHQPGASISLLMTPSGHGHYFHFLLDQYIAIRYLLDHIPESRAATILVHKHPRPFQSVSLDILTRRYPGLSVKEIEIGERITCDRLFTACRNFDDFIDLFSDSAMLRQIGADFRQHYGITTGEPRKRILISRKNQKLRRLLNEEALIQALVPLGFEVAYPETLEHKQQVELFSSAEVIIGSSGAAFTNLVFCRPGGLVVELCPRNLHMPFWFALARQSGLRHQFIECQSVDSYDSHEVEIESVTRLINRFST